MAKGVKLYDVTDNTLVYPRTVAKEVYLNNGKTLEDVINEINKLTTQINNSVEQFRTIIDDLDQRIGALE